MHCILCRPLQFALVTHIVFRSIRLVEHIPCFASRLVLVFHIRPRYIRVVLDRTDCVCRVWAPVFRVSLVDTVGQWRYNCGRSFLYHWRQCILMAHRWFLVCNRNLPSTVDRPIRGRRILRYHTLSMGYISGLDIH